MNILLITEQLKRIAGDGPPPGRKRFCRLTGLNNWAWEQFGLKWNDVVAQAGFKPNEFGENRFERDVVILRYIGLVRELGRLPVKRELHGKRKQDTTFPSAQAIENRLGRRRQQIEAVLEYCTRYASETTLAAGERGEGGAPGFDDVALMCREALEKEAGKTRRNVKPAGAPAEDAPGVYLLQCGSSYKIGKSNDPDQRISTLKRQLPQMARLLHVIRTDDPDGVERYWHARFQDKLIKNEWFRLDGTDVLAFQRCQMM